MTTRDAVQLGVAALFPLGLVGLMLAALARQRGRSAGEIAAGLAGIAACLLGVIATGVVLTQLRGGPLFDFTAGSFSLGSAGGADLIGLVVCAGCLLTALRVSKWLTAGKDADPPAESPPSDEEAGPT